MPNHITNCLSIAGSEEQIKELLEGLFQVDEDGNLTETIDFNFFDKQPESLNITDGGLGDIAERAIYDVSDNNWLTYERATQQFEELDDKRKKEATELAEAYQENRKLYGHKTWYGWSHEHWGTKWNAYSGHVVKREEDSIHITFQTAWSPPEPIFEKMIEMGFNISGIWSDQGDDTINDINDDEGDWYVEKEFKLF